MMQVQRYPHANMTRIEFDYVMRYYRQFDDLGRNWAYHPRASPAARVILDRCLRYYETALTIGLNPWSRQGQNQLFHIFGMLAEALFHLSLYID